MPDRWGIQWQVASLRLNPVDAALSPVWLACGRPWMLVMVDDHAASPGINPTCKG